MKYLYPFVIILAFTFLGELMNYFIPLPIPASIWGLLLLFGALGLAIGLLVRRPFIGMNEFVEEKLEETEVI